MSASWDHPRSRGVYTAHVKAAGNYIGSSPLARGLPRGSRRACHFSWIIPARAGFTSGAEDAAVAAEDHPRSRGVYVVLFSCFCL